MSRITEAAVLLGYARHLCDSREWQTTFWASRGAALLTRQAMERTLAEYWDATAPDVVHVTSMRASFLLLNAHIEPPAPGRAYSTWSQLSHVCHYRPLDLPPSREQAMGWIAEAEDFVRLLIAAHRASR